MPDVNIISRFQMDYLYNNEGKSNDEFMDVIGVSDDGKLYLQNGKEWTLFSLPVDEEELVKLEDDIPEDVKFQVTIPSFHGDNGEQIVRRAVYKGGQTLTEHEENIYFNFFSVDGDQKPDRVWVRADKNGSEVEVFSGDRGLSDRDITGNYKTHKHSIDVDVNNDGVDDTLSYSTITMFNDQGIPEKTELGYQFTYILRPMADSNKD